MDFMRGIKYPLQDQEWVKKIAIGALISFVPILNFAAVGFATDSLRNVYQGRETPLPTWDELGTLFVRGLMVVIIQLLWSLPLLVLLCPAFLLIGLAGAASGNEEPGALFALANICVWGLYAVAAVLLAPLMMVAQARFAVSNNFSDAMPGPVWGELRSNFRSWLIVMGFALLAGVLISVVSVPIVLLTLGLGFFVLIPLQFYLQLAAAHWQAQAHRESVGSVGLPTTML